MEKEYKICTRCIMDTSDPEIAFDEDGVCNHCKSYHKRTKYLYHDEELEKKIQKIKESGKGKKYDCVIGLSGGIDSSTVAYLVKKMGLKPIAVHLDNGWDAELAVSNIEKIVRKLNIDLYTHVVEWEEFKDLHLSFLKASVANIEIPTDHAIITLMYKTAADLGIKYIIHGGNLRSEGIMPFSWGYDARDLRHIRAIHKKFGKVRLKTFPAMGIWDWFYYSFVKKINYFGILNYIDYNKEKYKELLKKELGWQDYGRKHEESIFTKFFQNYILPKKFNIDKRRAHYSTLINSKQMTREDALEKIKQDPYDNEKNMRIDKEYVIKKLGISEEEFDRLMALQIKSYKEYPNNSLFFHKSAFIYSFLKKIIVR